MSAEVVFGLRPWEEEVERYHQLSPPRIRAENARKMIEAGDLKLDWLNCKPDGPVPLPGCRKLYVPLGKQAASEAPYGFVFLLVQRRDGTLAWTFVAFGERHPSNPKTRTVYERAYKRINGRYPS
ncbi:MAG TPA: hypothetical protein VHF88_01770 [Thermoleophilaceae bacterium]|nr:hypothetical protein [Thermoleophilaceae bacterium]